MRISELQRGDWVTLEGEEMEFVVFCLNESEVGVFPRYAVEDVDDKIWNQNELDWEVIGKKPLPLSEWYNPAARFDNEEAIVKYGVTFRQFVPRDQVLEVTCSIKESAPHVGDWALVDDENRGILAGVIESIDGQSVLVHFTHHKCAKASGHWSETVDLNEIILLDSTYRDLYKKCECQVADTSHS